MRGFSTNCANDNGDQHGGWQTLAADVAHHDQHAANAVADLLEEIATHLIGWFVGTFDCEPWALIQFVG